MGAMKGTQPATNLAEVYYPESDGKPMAETDLHRNEMFELIAMLEERYADAADVYVSGNLLLYFEEGNPAASVAPDTFVVFGVPKGQRRIYKLWAEGRPPSAVFEVTSRSTRREDLRTKRELYARLGVAEYFLYDPEAEYLRPPLQGFQLVGATYLPMTPDEAGTLRSQQLKLDLRLDADGLLQLYNISAGTRLLRLPEHRAALEQAYARAEWAETRAAVADSRAEHSAEQAALAEERAALAERENERLRAELARLLGDDGMGTG
jgi:Uma2 family endonuclease